MLAVCSMRMLPAALSILTRPRRLLMSPLRMMSGATVAAPPASVWLL
ncbi:hypothetical protein Y695_01128 [Hydrogenophaga sp. T4]|nr:hypothetical protein Y695_01128 [Hydrogenophaga sp. T4]